VDITPQIDLQGALEIITFMEQRPDGFASLEEVAAAIQQYQPHRPRPRNLDGLNKNVRLGEDRRYYWHWDPNWCKGALGLATNRGRFIAASESIRVPVLLVRGLL